MRTASVFALVVLAGALSAAVDDLSTMSFSDGSDRQLSDFAGQSLVVLTLTGKC